MLCAGNPSIVTTISSCKSNVAYIILRCIILLLFRPVIEYSVSKGADCNAKNRRGETPLHTSIEKRYFPIELKCLGIHCKSVLFQLFRLDDMTRLLVEKGDADVFAQDNTGKTPMDIAGLTPLYVQELRGNQRQL